MKLYCPSCNSHKVVCIGQIQSTNRFAGNVLDQSPIGVALFKCSSCHLYFSWPRIQKERLYALYQKGNINNWQYDPKKRKDLLNKSVIKDW